MSAFFSDPFEEGVLRLLFNRTSPIPSGTVYVAVGTSAATESGVDSWSGEVSGGGYARQPIGFLPRSVAGSMANSNSVIFPKATASWGSIAYFSLWTAASGGKMLVYGDCGPLTINSGSILLVPKGAITIVPYTAPGVKFSAYLHLKLQNHVFAKQSYSSPNIHLALAGTEPGVNTTGSQLDEQSGAGYARKAWSAWNDPVQTAQDNGRATNNGAINWNQATAEWTVMSSYVVLTDASTGGNVLCWEACSSATSMANGDTPHFDNAALAVETLESP